MTNKNYCFVDNLNKNMDYVELKCLISPFSEDVEELLISALLDLGYESFMSENQVLKSYIPENLFDINNVKSNNIIQNIQEKNKFEFSYQKIEPKDWNAKWESEFQPVVVDNKVYIRSSFHKKNDKYEFEIIIDPKMSFGTGHSESTSLMISSMLEIDFKNKKVLDMGCGTSILGIFAAKKQAKEVVGVDIDEWAYNNSIENILLNNISNLKIVLGDAKVLKDLEKFDIILANINLNILLSDIREYYNSLTKNGILIISGIYLEDLETLNQKAKQIGFKYLSHKQENNWISVNFGKI